MIVEIGCSLCKSHANQEKGKTEDRSKGSGREKLDKSVKERGRDPIVPWSNPPKVAFLLCFWYRAFIDMHKLRTSLVRASLVRKGIAAHL